MLEVWNKDDETGALSPTFFRLQRKKREKVWQKNYGMRWGKINSIQALSNSWAAANQKN